MAQFKMMQAEGMNWVRMTLANETVRAEAWALCYMVGDIVMDSRLPSVGQWIKSSLADESIVRPTYTGTGEVYLESSLGGFHVIDLKGDEWILESGSYWASDGSVKVSTFRERIVTSFWSGEGLIDYQTKVSGAGKVVVTANGPVDEVELKDGRLAAEGKYVIGRTGSVAYRIRRPTRTYLGYLVSGESHVRSYEGSGRLLVCATPYWRLRYQDRAGAR